MVPKPACADNAARARRPVVTVVTGVSQFQFEDVIASEVAVRDIGPVGSRHPHPMARPFRRSRHTHQAPQPGATAMATGSFELKLTARKKYHFVLKATNGRVILSSEHYESKPSALNGIESVRKNGPVDARFERKSSKRGEPYFVLKATNGEIIGTSEMYRSAKNMENGIAAVITHAAAARLKDLSEAKAPAKAKAKAASKPKSAAAVDPTATMPKV